MSAANQRQVQKMRAIVYRSASDHSKVGISSWPEPIIQPNQVLVQVKAFGLNYADVIARNGHYNDAPPFPFVPGYEFSGIILDIGPKAKEEGFKLQVGDKVFGFSRFGGYAEKVATMHNAVWAIPEGMDWATAASVPVQFITAYHCLHNTGLVRKGDRVLVHSAAGGVGQLLVQLAKLAGCVVIGTASSPAKLKLLKDQFGLDHGINYVETDFEEETRKIFNTPPGKGCVDIILDAVTGSQIKKDVALLRANGRVVGYGASGLSDRSLLGIVKLIPQVVSMVTLSTIDLLLNCKSFIGINALKIADEKPELFVDAMERFETLWRSKQLKTIVSQTLPWTKVGQAQKEMEDRKTTGKIVFTIDEEEKK